MQNPDQAWEREREGMRRERERDGYACLKCEFRNRKNSSRRVLIK